jgi:hypothetical protein
MIRYRLIAVLFASVLLGGCVAVRIGTDAEPPEFEMKSWGNAFATIGDLPEYDGAIVAAHLFRGGKRTGEIAAIDIWPVLGVDVGVLGLRVRLFNLEAGAGTLFYRPRPMTEFLADADADIPE